MTDKKNNLTEGQKALFDFLLEAVSGKRKYGVVAIQIVDNNYDRFTYGNGVTMEEMILNIIFANISNYEKKTDKQLSKVEKMDFARAFIDTVYKAFIENL